MISGISGKEENLKMETEKKKKNVLSHKAVRVLIYIICLLVIAASVIVIVMNLVKKSRQSAEGSELYFDTYCEIEIYDLSASVSASSLVKTAFNMCDTYEGLFDMYDEDSEVSLLNSAGGVHTAVSEETAGIMNVAKFFGELSDGAFDITIGSVSSLWDFDSEDPSVPDEDEIASALENVNYEDIIIYYEYNEIASQNENTTYDLGGLAKGYVSTQIKEYFEDQGVTSAMINLGGNIELIGSKKDGSDFTIGIQYPFEDDGETICAVKASDVAISTSGVYERYFYDEDGNFYTHILDPETGYPVDSGLLSVTVIAADAQDADPLATAALIMGLEDGMEMIEDYIYCAAIFVTEDYEIYLTSDLEIDGDTVTLTDEFWEL